MDTTLEAGVEGVFPGGQYHSLLGRITPFSVSNDHFAEYLTGDQFSDICRIALASKEDDTARDDVLVGPGEYVLTWKRFEFEL